MKMTDNEIQDLINEFKGRKQLWVGNSVSGQLWVGNSVSGQLGGQLEYRLWDQLWGQLVGGWQLRD